ncbi:CENPK protein, partial [Melanocharis versteri]|nr:CENPK protein [Melanocharis versteri]
PVDAKEEILDECESVWRQIEECHNKLMFQGIETLPQSDAKLSLLMLQWQVLAADHRQWLMRNPEIISANPDVLLELGKEELQKVKNDLEMLLSTVRSKNKQLEEDLIREQQWYEEQKQMLDALDKTQEDVNTQVEKLYTKRGLSELKNKVLKLKTYQKELLSALGEFLDEYFPLPEKGVNKNSSAEPAVELISFQDIVEMLLTKFMTTPHEPYVIISESFWPPYIELLLRCEMAVRHPEDPNRVRLQAFHK